MTSKMDFTMRYARWEQLFPQRQPKPPNPTLVQRYTFPLNFEFAIAQGLFRQDPPAQHTAAQQANPPCVPSFVAARSVGADSDYDRIDDVFDAEARMVQLVEVEDEHFQHAQEGPVEDDGDYTDTGTISIVLSSSSRPFPSRLLACRPWRRCCACDAIGQKK
jgi:hypothetical protein